MTKHWLLANGDYLELLLLPHGCAKSVHCTIERVYFEAFELITKTFIRVHLVNRGNYEKAVQN